MRNGRLWAGLLGVEKTTVGRVEFDEDRGLLIAHVRPARGERRRCGMCRRRCPGYDQGVDHDSRRLVWAAAGRDTHTLRRRSSTVGRERQAPVLQVPRDPVAPTGPPRGRGLRRALPAAWAGPHRLPRAGPAAPAGAAVRPPGPPRPADDHRSATGGELGDQAGQRRRGGLAARSSPGAMAGADRGQVRRLVSGVRAARPRRRRDPARRHRLEGRVPARRVAAAHLGEVSDGLCKT